MANLIKPCPPGVDPKDWLPIDGMTKRGRSRMFWEIACRWWDNLPQEQRDEFDYEYEKAFGGKP